MKAGVGLLVSDMMPIYMIIPRYSHNYAQFCQWLDNNLFTHRKILMLLRESTSETYVPRVYLLSYKFSIYLFWTWCLYTWSSPRYTHNCAQFCQLLNSNLFTHRRILMLSREATSETYGPPGLFSSYQSLSLYLLALFLLCLLHFYFASIYQKYQKYYLSDLTPVSEHEGIDNP